MAVTVSKEKFDAILKTRVDIRPCKRCGAHPEIVVLYPWYGRTGAKLVCRRCGTETELHSITLTLLDEDGRLGTPMTFKSMRKGIESAVNTWNQTCGTKMKGGERE